MSTRFVQFKKEIDQLNLIFSAYVSELNTPKKLITLGFSPWLEPVIEKKNPDFVFAKDGYALIIEAKSGSASPEDFADIKRYLRFDIKRLEKNIADIGIKFPIYKYDVGVVYYKNKLEESLQHKDIKNEIDNLSNEALILTISQGGYLKLYSGTAKDTDTHKLLEKGIKVPKNPKREIKITSSSPVEGIVYKIILDVCNRMEIKKSMVLDENQIFNEIFKNYRINFHRVKKALNSLKKMRIINKKDRKYVFTKRSISDGLELIRRFQNNNLDELIKEEKQKSIDEFTDSS